jgi:CubicO group peptidase (beta-lactamase class C family)
MTDTTFYPTKAQRARLATAYAKNKDAGLVPVPPRAGFGAPEHPPQGNGGLFSTPQDYARFCQLLLGQGTVGSQRLLSPAAVKSLASIHTGEIPTGFFQTEQWGKRGANYGWGVGTCILRTPHPGHGEMLSPGSYGHGGAWGTQAWIDPVRGVAYLLFVQRSNFPNSDGSDVRLGFQRAAAAALAQ